MVGKYEIKNNTSILVDHQRQRHVHRESKKHATKLAFISSSNTGRFFKFFYWHTLWKICSNQGRRHGGPRGAPPDESTYVRTQKYHVISTKGLRSFVYICIVQIILVF